jgi:uncharacterized protein (DUF433 family)
MSESYRYIVRSVDVRGGNARVEGTRIAVHDVIGLLQNGESVESITATCLPMLSDAELVRPSGRHCFGCSNAHQLRLSRVKRLSR